MRRGNVLNGVAFTNTLTNNYDMSNH